jgi:hypothetical protein
VVDLSDEEFKEAVAERKAQFANTGKESWILPQEKMELRPGAAPVATAVSVDR